VYIIYALIYYSKGRQTFHSYRKTNFVLTKAQRGHLQYIPLPFMNMLRYLSQNKEKGGDTPFDIKTDIPENITSAA